MILALGMQRRFCKPAGGYARQSAEPLLESARSGATPIATLLGGLLSRARHPPKTRTGGGNTLPAVELPHSSQNRA